MSLAGETLRNRMRLLFTLITIFCFTCAEGQTFSEFPGTGFGIILPDSSFHYFKEREFASKKYRASVVLLNKEADPDLSNVRFEKSVELFRKDMLTPGITILLEEVLTDSSRLIKTRINFDSTDAKPATKGRTGIGWLYFYNHKGSPVIIMGSYDTEHDKVLHGLYYRSLKTLKPVDAAAAGDLFKNKFIITNDYAPLKYYGESLGGTLLNMEGKYPATGADSSYYLVVPVNIILPPTDRENMRSYLRKRLSIHAKDDIRSLGFGSTSGNFFRTWYMSAETKDNRILYICIKADDKGYFEIWGEAYHNNKKLLDVFEKISDSLKRN